MSDVIGKAVVDAASGRKLGRAWDVRVRRENKQRPIGKERWVATALVISRAGALERFGFVQLHRTSPAGSWLSKRGTVPWEAIESIGEKEIRVNVSQ